MTRLLTALLISALAGCTADGGLKPGVGEAILGVGVATLAVAAGVAAARQPVYVEPVYIAPAPVYVVPERRCYATPFGWRC